MNGDQTSDHLIIRNVSRKQRWLLDPCQYFTPQLSLVEDGLNQIWNKEPILMPSLTDTLRTDLDRDNELGHNPDSDIFDYFNLSYKKLSILCV